MLSDGTINGHGYGRILVEGKTLQEVQNLIRKRLSKTLRQPVVSVLLRSQRQDLVFVSGSAADKGPIVLIPGTDLRQVIASVQLPGDQDLLEAELYRAGSPSRIWNVSDILRGGSPSGNTVLQPNDVIVLRPIAYMRVWVTGAVQKPGEERAKVGTDVYQAIAQAGGIDPKLTADTDLQIQLRRGSEVRTLPGRQDPNVPTVPLESGDTVIVQQAAANRVSVGGDVVQPGQFNLTKDDSLFQAISRAGGPTASGDLSSVMVIRNGTTQVLDATTTGVGKTFALQDGDLVIVQKNERFVTAVGPLNKPGRVLLDKDKTYRLSDILAQAGGLTTQGSLHRVYLARTGPNGTYHVAKYALDKFLKDGDLPSNPEVRPGDVVLFGQPQGISSATIQQAITSGLFLLPSLRL